MIKTTGQDAMTEFWMNKLKALGCHVTSCTIMLIPILFLCRTGSYSRPESVLKEVQVDFTVKIFLKPNNRKAYVIYHTNPNHALRSRRLVSLNDFDRTNRSPHVIVLPVRLLSENEHLLISLNNVLKPLLRELNPKSAGQKTGFHVSSIQVLCLSKSVGFPFQLCFQYSPNRTSAQFKLFWCFSNAGSFILFENLLDCCNGLSSHLRSSGWLLLVAGCSLTESLDHPFKCHLWRHHPWMFGVVLLH